MDKSLYSTHQQILQSLLREIRCEAGLRQQDLADQIDEPQSFVSKIEIGERRLDILELRQLCLAMDISLNEFVKRLEKKLKN